MVALVTGGSRRAALGVIRSLGRRGIEVAVGDSVPGGPGTLSRYARRVVRYPLPNRDPSGYVESLLAHVRAHPISVLFPIHDFEIFPVLERKDEFERYTRVPFPDLDTFQATWDKRRTIAVASRAGVRTPPTYEVTPGDVRRVARDLPYPVVIKPASQSFQSGGRRQTAHVTTRNYAANQEQFCLRYEAVRAVSPHPLVQAWVNGYGAGAALLCNQGEPRAAFAYRRIREYPASGGPSTLRESIEAPALIEAATKVLRALRWHGVAMVEFKVPPSGEPILLEVNGRFWGSLALALAAGVDFPFLLYRMALDGDVEPVDGYPIGVRCRWILPGDLLWLWTTRGSPQADLHGFFDLRSTHFDYLARDDPLPVAGALVTALRQLRAYLSGTRSLSGEYVGRE